jgi:hypothetical protein
VPPGTSVDVVRDRDRVGRSSLAVTVSDFRRGLADLAAGYPELARELAAVKPPFRLLNALGLEENGVTRGYFIVSPPGLVARDGQVQELCWRLSSDPAVQRFVVAYVESAREVR